MMHKRWDRARKHLTIAAKHGHGASLDYLREYHVPLGISKEEFDIVQLPYQSAVNATNSPQRAAGKHYFLIESV